jgi:hypothetical protein
MVQLEQNADRALVLAVVDWEQSGWLSEYWEARKAQYTAFHREEWSTKFRDCALARASLGAAIQPFPARLTPHSRYIPIPWMAT